MMNEYEAGRDSKILAYMLNGQKTIEVRLNRDKFAQLQPGDHVRIREDVYQNGKVVEQIPDRAVSEILKINQYESFRELFETEGIKHIIPYSHSVDAAIQECRKFYSEAEEKKYGVLAIHFKIIKKPGGPI